MAGRITAPRMNVSPCLSTVRPPLALAAEDERISSLDPLHADAHLCRLPHMNAAKDTVGLALLLADLLPSMDSALAFDTHQACAVMRDLGFLLGSLKRHGVEPVEVTPQLEEKTNLLGWRSSLPPRDTLLHYTVWNPTGHRRRTYTGTKDETNLIDSVVLAMHPLTQAILLLENLHRTPFQHPSFAEVCRQVQTHFEKVIEGVVLARRSVSPAYFANELRFYFDPITLNGRQYLGPGAVEMPMFVFDHLLWGSDCADVHYTEFKGTYVPYIHPVMRAVYAAFPAGTPSLVTKICGAAAHGTDVQPAIKALKECMRQLKSFRMPHKKLAEEAYAHSGAENRTHGSGGYSTDILSHILHLMNKQAETLNAF